MCISKADVIPCEFFSSFFSLLTLSFDALVLRVCWTEIANIHKDWIYYRFLLRMRCMIWVVCICIQHTYSQYIASSKSQQCNHIRRCDCITIRALIHQKRFDRNSVWYTFMHRGKWIDVDQSKCRQLLSFTVQNNKIHNFTKSDELNVVWRKDRIAFSHYIKMKRALIYTHRAKHGVGLKWNDAREERKTTVKDDNYGKRLARNAN